MSTQTFDIYSYIASLTGNASIIQNKISSLNSEITDLSARPQTTSQVIPVSEPAFGEPASITQIVPSAAANTISSDRTQLPGLQTQLDQLNAQIKAAQTTASSIPRAVGITDTIGSSSSSLGTTLSSLKLPSLSGISPVYLVAGAALIFLILR